MMMNNTVTQIDRFLKTAADMPQKTAVMDKSGSYTYDELRYYTDFFAARLINDPSFIRGAVLLPRGKDYLLSALSVLRAGITYIPLDSSYPEERVRMILEDAGKSFIITDHETALKFKDLTEAYGSAVVFADDIIELAKKEYLSGNAADREEINLFYKSSEALLIYTSGSTGRPKGVLHGRRVFDTMEMPYWQDQYEISSGDVFGFMTGFTFIVSLCTLFLPICIGSSIYIFDAEERLDPGKMAEVIDRLGITVMCLAPKLIDTMFRLYPDNGLKCVMAGGEKIVSVPENHAVVLENYGCSECGTILWNRIYPGLLDAVLGIPRKGIRTFLIDEKGDLINTPDTVGELCVVSDSNALRYNNMPEASKLKFVPCPFIEGTLMCRTGDLMSLNADGLYVYHGRSDYMVKINGHRVEMSEIEGTVNRFSGVNENVCVVKSISGADTICCYYAADSDISEALKAHVKKYLPAYMVPAVWVRLEHLPRNINGKIDRKALPVPQKTDSITEAGNNVESIFLDLARELTGRNDFGVSDDLQSMGIDSIKCMELSLTLKQHGIDVTGSDIIRYGSIRAVLQNGKSYAWFMEKPDPGKSTLVFAQGIIYWKAAVPLCRRLSEKYNVLVIGPVQDYFDPLLKGRTFDDLIDIYMGLIKKITEGAAAPVGVMGISFGGEIAAGLCRAWELEYGKRIPCFMGDTLLKTKDEYYDRDLTFEDLPEAALKGANAVPAEFLKRADMVNKLGSPVKYASYDGPLVYYAANRYSDQQTREKKERLVKSRYGGCLIKALDDKSHTDLFSDEAMAGMYVEDIEELKVSSSADISHMKDRG